MKTILKVLKAIGLCLVASTFSSVALMATVIIVGLVCSWLWAALYAFGHIGSF